MRLGRESGWDIPPTLSKIRIRRERSCKCAVL